MSYEPKIPLEVDQFFLLAPNLDAGAPPGIARFANYCMTVPRGINIDLLDRDFLNYLFSPEESIPQDQFMPISKLLFAARSVRPDLQKAFDIQTPAGRYHLLRWFLFHGCKELFQAFPFSVRHVRDPAPGVNLIGFVHTNFGLGEFLRSTRKSLDAYSVPHHSIDTEERSFEVKYGVNIFCLPGMEHYKLPFVYDWSLFNQTYNIGYWPWELAEWAPKYNFCFGASNEIWAISKFSQEALQKSTTQLVFHMPIAVMPPAPSSMTRKDFGLESSRFYFLTIFDFNSYVARKNPMATVRAFKKAFVQNENVGIVFKTLNLNVENEASKFFMEAIAGDPRFVVLNEDMPKEKLWALIGSCNSYVSLHRAEGFGLPIAEAMLMGLSIICTAYSGNLDFTHEDNSYLVKYDLIEITPGEYHFFEPGQKWADPSVDHAAQLMLEVFQKPEEAKKKALKGKALIETEFSTQAIGAKLSKRIQEIYLLRQ